MQLLTHISYAFSTLQESTCHIQTPIYGSLQNVMQMPDIPPRNFDPDMLHECLLDPDKITKENTSSTQSPTKYFAGSFGASLPHVHLVEPIDLSRKNVLVQSPVSENQHSTDLVNNSCKIQNGVINASSQSCLTGSNTSNDAKHSAEKSRA